LIIDASTDPMGVPWAPDQTTIDQALIRGLATASPVFRRRLPQSLKRFRG
jgi:hypothetical protein